MKYLFLLGMLMTLVACSSTRGMRTPSTEASGSRQSIAQEARKWEGRSYKYGGTTPKGFDCSGFVQYVYGRQGVSLPRTTSELAKYGRKVSRSQIQPGDLVFFAHRSKIHHVAIVLQADSRRCLVAHSTTSRGVLIEDVFASSYWEPRYIFARSVL